MCKYSIGEALLANSSIGQQLRTSLLPLVKCLRSFLARILARFRYRGHLASDGEPLSEDGRHRTGDYWSAQFEAMRTDQSYWMNNKLIEESTYRLMTDTAGHWLEWLLHTYFAQHSFRRSLSICCGDGAHEIQLFQSGKVQCVTGFDISPGAIDQAIARFKKVSAPTDRYRFDVRDVNALELDGTFDLILSTGALHHTTNLEDLLGKVERALASGGYFVAVEFIGPNRFQWTDRQVEIANRILGSLDPFYLRDGAHTRFERPSVESMLRVDPSEAVRSTEVYPLVKKHFEIRYERFYNGTLLHQLHPLLNTALANRRQRDFDSIVRLILLMEDLLVKNEVLSSDFVFVIGQKRDVDTRQTR